MFAWVVRDRFLLHLLLGGEGRDEGEQLFAPERQDLNRSEEICHSSCTGFPSPPSRFF